MASIMLLTRGFALSLTLVWAACLPFFGSDFEVDYDAELVRVETVDGPEGPIVECDVVLRATAVGDDGEQGIIGEASFAFRRLSDGVIVGSERRSSAFMGQRFGSETIRSGETLTTAPFQRTADAAFDWEMQLFYRRPGGTRGDEELSVRCAP